MNIHRLSIIQNQVRSVDVKEAYRLQQENNFVLLDVRPIAEFKEVSSYKTLHILASMQQQSNINYYRHIHRVQ